MANITIVDNIVRAIPLMTKTAIKFKDKDKKYLNNIINNFFNKENLELSLKEIEKNSFIS